MVELRPYRPGDQDAVVTLWWESWHSIRPGLRHPRPFADLAARWANEIVPQQKIVVAEDDGAVVGFAAADVGAHLLSQIFIAPARKRQGIGRQLFAWAQRSMPDGFTLHTLVDNVASRAFYERHGLVAGDTEINPANGMRTIEYRWKPKS
jgi:ribosomal protein S18 acetylase RimI-like enzyme